MQSIQKIKEVLFSTEAMQARFISDAEAIAGEDFDTKLANLLRTGREEDVQLILAPFLREAVYLYLSDNSIPEAIHQKESYSSSYGAYAYENAENGLQEMFEELDPQINAMLNRQSNNDFRDIKNQFIMQQGLLVWEKILHDIEIGQATDEAVMFKTKFVNMFADSETAVEVDSKLVWDRAYNTSESIQSFETLREHFIDSWGEEKWHTCSTIEDMPAPSTPDTIEELDELSEELELPLPLTAEESFAKKRQEFIQTYGQEAWKTATSGTSVSHVFLHSAQKLKQQFISEQGQKVWDRIKKPPEQVAAFDAMMFSFLCRFTQQQWNLFVNKTDQDLEILEDLGRPEDLRALHDFKELKRNFLSKFRGNHAAWEAARNYPPISIEADAFLKRSRDNFIQYWGDIAWNYYIETHRKPHVYAKETQLTILADLFNLRMDITTINDGVVLTTQHVRRKGVATIHFYCEDFSHYYVHENGYFATIPDGNCAYNGFAQWLQFLICGTQPRKSIVLPPNTEHHADSYSMVISAINGLKEDVKLEPEIQDALSVVLPSEEITIQSICKELKLDYAPNKKYSEFLLAKIQDIIHVIRARKLPYNRVNILNRITYLVKQLSTHDNYSALIILQTTLVKLVNTLNLPHAQGVDVVVWDDEKFRNNILELQTSMLEQLPEEQFGNLGELIKTTDFHNKSPEPFLSSLFAPQPQTQPSPSYSQLTYHSMLTSQPLPEEDWLSAALCIAGIFLLITGLACFSGLILASLVTGPGYLGLYLMNIGLQTLATTLAGVLGLSASTTAVFVATTGSIMISGLGFSLFKDFAPPAMLSHSPLLAPAPY